MEDGVVRTRPIKGTRPRATDPAEDARLAAELAADEKERAENLMIVDLMRNDLARVCPPGEVAVTGLFEVVSHPQVHQLVSTIEGRLAPGRDAVDAIAACFPAGSMTGTPKRRAIELLDELEGEDRGPYAGAFGRLGQDGSADLAMTIRTIAIDDAVHRCARKPALDQRRRLSRIEPMDRLVGIMHWNPGFREHAGSRGFAHADRSGKTEDDHLATPTSARIRFRKVSLTVGRRPNQRSKPGTA